jgi:hypothetical protein
MQNGCGDVLFLWVGGGRYDLHANRLQASPASLTTSAYSKSTINESQKFLFE